jgi:hypothetical protein
MKEQVILFEYTAMKGIFFKKPAAKILSFGITFKDMFAVMQVVGEYDGRLVTVLASGARTTDQKYVDEIIDTIKYDSQIEILEIIPSLSKVTTSKMVVVLKKPSKYIGPKIVFNFDDRLDYGYYFTDIKIKKKDLEPIVVYKVGADQGKMKATKSFLGTKFAALTKNKLTASFKMK